MCVIAAGGYVKSIVSLGWSIWTCNSKSMRVFADQGSLLGSQQASAELASQLAAATSREAALKTALANEQRSRQDEAAQAADRAAKAADAAEKRERQVLAIVLDAAAVSAAAHSADDD